MICAGAAWNSGQGGCQIERRAQQQDQEAGEANVSLKALLCDRMSGMRTSIPGMEREAWNCRLVLGAAVLCAPRYVHSLREVMGGTGL